MKFEQAIYTDITELALEVNPNYTNEGYVKFFICADVWDFWFIRILKGQRCDDDEGYVPDEDNYIMERNNIPMDFKCEKLYVAKVKQLIENDGGDNWDLEQSEDIEELIEMLDNGFGLN
jgi:hypothetical protein